MNYLCMEGADHPVRAMVLALDEEELEPASVEDPSAYHHIRLGDPDFFGDAGDLEHEHLILTTAPYPATQGDLDIILDQTLGLDRQTETVRVVAITPEIVRTLRHDPGQPHRFDLTYPLPIVIVLLGGSPALEQWKEQNFGEMSEGDD